MISPMDVVNQIRGDMAERQANALREQRERAYAVMRVPRRYWDASMSFIPDSCEYKRQLVSWYDKFLAAQSSGQVFPGLFLHGHPGSGKSAIAAGTLKWAYEHKIMGLWLDYAEIVEVAKDDPEWYPGLPSGLWTAVQRATILVVDDVLRQGLGNAFNAYQARLLEQLLRQRWSNGLTTVLTANSTLGDLSNGDLATLAGVIDEATYAVEVVGVNFRRFGAAAKVPL